MTNESKRDWENFFAAPDFYKVSQAYCSNENSGKVVDPCLLMEIQRIVVVIANEIIRKELEKAPTVYGLKVTSNSELPNEWLTSDGVYHTDTAKLVCIEEIKK